MDRGQIPGFYYDEEKKKYFKVQANHLVPNGAKYSKGSIKQEQRQVKKRKSEEKKQARLHKQAVQRSSVLRNPILGSAGLGREHGGGPRITTSSLIAKDTALVSQWQPQRVQVNFPGERKYSDMHLTHARYLSATQQIITAQTDSFLDVSALHVSPWDWNALAHDKSFDMQADHGIAWFNGGSISSVSTSTYGNVARVLVCTYQSVGNVHMSPITSPSDTESINPVGIRLTIRPPPKSVFSQGRWPINSCINHRTGITAILAQFGISLLDAHANYLNKLVTEGDQDMGIQAVDWLDANTIAYPCDHVGDQEKRTDHDVMLWDTRTTGGTSTRFSLRERITGILNPSSEHPGNQLLVSTNHAINLLDTRMPKAGSAPILSFSHIHGGPKLQFAANGQSLVAVADRDDGVQVYSLRSGTRVATLGTPKQQRDPVRRRYLRNLAWYEDGASLQAEVENDVLRWTWSGSDDDNAYP